MTFSRPAAVILLALLAVPGMSWASDKPFDSSRDPEQDLAQAEKQAVAEHKNILLDFGANWCVWCLKLDRNFHDDEALAAKLRDRYVVVHVDIGGVFFGSKKAAKLRARLPKFNSYPHLMVLNAAGTLVHDESKTDLSASDDRKDFDRGSLMRFLDAWEPKG